MKNNRLNARGNVRRYMAERMSENMPDRMQERYDMQEKYGGNNFKTYVKTPRNHGHFKNLNGTDLLEVATIYKAYVPTKYNWIEYPYITYIYLYHL